MPYDCLKLAFLGDGHLTPNTPASRIDSYGETCLRKLSNVLSRCQALGVVGLFWTGDVFNSPSVPLAYVNQAIPIIRSSEVPVYVIPGNHDLPHHKAELMDRTALGNLILSGVVTRLERVTFEVLVHEPRYGGDNTSMTVQVVGGGVGVEPPAREASIDRSVLVEHAFWAAGQDDYVLTSEAAEILGHDIYVLGHDHIAYDTLSVKGEGRKFTVVRPGSMTRATSHFHQVQRSVQFAVVEYGGGKGKVWMEPIECLSPDQVYAARVFEPARALLKNVEKFIDALEGHRVRVGSVYELLDGMEIPNPVRDRVRTLLQEKGLMDDRVAII